jgi:hypothetical protein
METRTLLEDRLCLFLIFPEIRLGYCAIAFFDFFSGGSQVKDTLGGFLSFAEELQCCLLCLLSRLRYPFCYFAAEPRACVTLTKAPLLLYITDEPALVQDSLHYRRQRAESLFQAPCPIDEQPVIYLKLKFVSLVYTIDIADDRCETHIDRVSIEDPRK